MEEKMNAEEVISKLKDDGDFDRLRLKIVRQLKQNVFFFLSLPSSTSLFICSLTYYALYNNMIMIGEFLLLYILLHIT